MGTVSRGLRRKAQAPASTRSSRRARRHADASSILREAIAYSSSHRSTTLPVATLERSACLRCRRCAAPSVCHRRFQAPCIGIGIGVGARFCDLFRCLWSVSVSVVGFCFGAGAPTEWCSHRNRNRYGSQKSEQVRIAATGTETDTDHRNRNRNRKRHGSQKPKPKQKPAPKQKILFRADKNQKGPAPSARPFRLRLRVSYSAGCGATDLALPPVAFTPALNEILIM